jgi:glycerol-3-phosphate acyltransferase PlsY
MTTPVEVALLLGLGFAAGAIPTGYWLARGRGLDLRRAGSGNIGATNVARTLGKGWGILTLVIDAAKGALPVWLALSRGVPAWVCAATGAAAILGHVFTPWLGFRGGKGVATAAGVFLTLAPAPTAISAAIYALCFATLRISSIGSLAATTALPFLLWAFDADLSMILFATSIAVFIAFTHRGNIARLLGRRENRF